MSSKVIPRGSVSGVRRVEPRDLAAAVGRAGAPAPPAHPEADAERERAEAARVSSERQRELEQAYQAGLEAGRREAQAIAAQQRAEVQALIVGINELMEGFEQRLASEVLSISVELAKLIVRAGVRVKPSVVLPVLRDAMASLPGMPEQATLLLNPADAQLVREFVESDPAAATLPWNIVEDPHIERGGCKLETASTEVDATLETRWRRVIAALGRDDGWMDIAV